MVQKDVVLALLGDLPQDKPRGLGDNNQDRDSKRAAERTDAWDTALGLNHVATLGPSKERTTDRPARAINQKSGLHPDRGHT